MNLVIKIPKDAYDLLQNEGVDWLGAEHILDAVAKGKPVEECEDCVSRQEALSHARKEGTKFEQPYEVIDADVIRALPPVTPKQTFESMTNGEVIQALFPKIKVKPLVGVKGLLHVFFDKKEDNAFDEDWWNAPYKGGEQNESN